MCATQAQSSRTRYTQVSLNEPRSKWGSHAPEHLVGHTHLQTESECMDVHRKHQHTSHSRLSDRGQNLHSSSSVRSCVAQKTAA